MVVWMIYGMLVSALVAGSALVLERALGARRAPLRGIWAGALVLSLGIPVASWIVAGTGAGAPPALMGVAEVVQAPAGGAGEGATAGPSTWAALERLDPVTRQAWPAASLLLLFVFGGSAYRLSRTTRRWRLTRLDGVRVRVSHAVGPALIGVLRPEIVLPSWVLDLDPADRALVLRHEQEHRRSGDPHLVLAGFLAVVAVPWNPVMWWQLGRLRGAVETDCDRRVLEGRPWSDRRRYGELLLRVGERVAMGAHRPALAGFAERGTSLERRIRVMFDVTQLLSPKRLVVWIVAAVGLVVTATLIPRPAREAPPEIETPPEIEIPPPPRQVVEAGPETEAAPLVRPETTGPVFTPYTVGPEITNRTEAQRALEAAYPALLRDAGIGGTVRVWFHIDEEGVVTDTRLVESSGSPPLDEAALEVADVLRFSPALNRDRAVPVWVQFPIVFGVR